jgi:chromate reductase
MFGAAWAQAELRKALGLAGARVLDQELAVPTAHEAFKEDGRLARAATRRRLRSLLADLIAEVTPTTQATAPGGHEPRPQALPSPVSANGRRAARTQA